MTAGVALDAAGIEPREGRPASAWRCILVGNGALCGRSVEGGQVHGPGAVHRGADVRDIVPVVHDAGARVGQDLGGCAVLLADAQHRPPCRQILEHLSGKDIAVLGFLPQGKDEQGGAALLGDGLVVGPVAEVDEVGAESARLDGCGDGLIDLADEADTQRILERVVSSTFVCQDVPEYKGIAVLGKQSRMCHAELRRLLPVVVTGPCGYKVRVVVLVETIGDEDDGRAGHLLELPLYQRGDGDDG